MSSASPSPLPPLEAPAGGTWIRAIGLDDLSAKGSTIVKADGKQILVFKSESGIYACNNRCPHEGYPLKEGTLTQGCILTCNWHNWKFDLESGKTLVGSDQLRRYPVELRDGAVWLDISDPPREAQVAAALAALSDSFDHIDERMEYARVAREIARLQKAGGDPLEALRKAVEVTYDHFEYGTTHAIAAAPDWLALGAELARDPAEELVPLLESISHLAWDSMREPVFAYSDAVKDFAPAAFLAAIEAEDEGEAVAQLRGALASGLTYEDLEPHLAEAALSHYADFGHSAIYVYKTGQLLGRLGDEMGAPLLLALVRSLVYATREDLLPEFRGYDKHLAAWPRADATAAAAPTAEDFRGLSAKQAMARCLDFPGDPEKLFDALYAAAAWSQLHFDRDWELSRDSNVSDNVGWLDFTHALTFGNAVHQLCRRHPHLWPAALLQLACFVGRNQPYVKAGQDVAPWRVTDPTAFFEDQGHALFDHGQPEYIVSAHLVKVFTAVREEVLEAPDAPWAEDLLAATKRFMTTPLKRKHAARTARQSLAFVALEG
jgi:nitrite reductase/ring-hydroxylating ferredoxin subunit